MKLKRNPIVVFGLSAVLMTTPLTPAFAAEAEALGDVSATTTETTTSTQPQNQDGEMGVVESQPVTTNPESTNQTPSPEDATGSELQQESPDTTLEAQQEPTDGVESVEVETQASTTFTFSNTGITGTADGAEAKDTTLNITKAGTYVVTGSCDDGQITVKKDVSGVTIVLDNLTLKKDADKAIKFKAGSSGTIELVGNNSLSTTNDKGVIKANAAADDSDNIIYDQGGATTGGDLVIQGGGSLTLSSDYSAVVDGETEGCDAINCEGDLTVLSGTFDINVTDDAMHADNTLTIGANGTDGPTIKVTNATEGLEGASVRLLSGTSDIVTSDDGVNAANSDLASYGWQYGVEVAGGTWKVVSGGDGIDSNGNLTVSGGTTEVYCTGNGNGALDIGEGMEGEIRGTFSVTGGTLFAVGSDMMITPGTGKYVLFGGQNGMPGGMRPMAVETDEGAAGDEAALDAQAWSGTTLVTNGQATTVKSGDTTLFTTTAAASGSYALFASDAWDGSSELTLTSGSSSTTSGAGQGQQPGQPGQPGQQPGQPGQPGQQSGQPGQPSPSGAISYPDVAPNAWYAGVVGRSTQLGLFSGYENGCFGPEDNVNRGQVAVVLWRMAGEPAVSAGVESFPDVKSGAYCAKAVAWARSVGVVSGYSDGRFGPEDLVTREQLATMLASYTTKVAGKDSSGAASDYASMKDAAKVSGWAQPSVGFCFRNKIMSGTEAGCVNPQGNATRAEAAKMTVSLHDML